MRNPAVTLSPAQILTANFARGMIVSLPAGATVKIDGRKRDGCKRTYIGTVEGLVGKDSHEAVVIETSEGRKSMNLYNVDKISHLIPA